MKAKLFLVMLCSVFMVLSLVGCKDKTDDVTEDTRVSEEAAENVDTTENVEVTTEVPTEASVDFEDGLFGFMAVDTSKGNADESVLSLEDYNGSKALKVTVTSKVPYVVIDIEGLLGEKMADVRTIQVDFGVESPDGNFYACSGNVYAYTSADNVETKYGWSVYLEDKNPKTASLTLNGDLGYLATGLGNKIMISKEVDNGGEVVSNLFIDNIRFLDPEGNVITADTTAVYVPAVTEVDMSNLAYLKNVVEFTGFAITGDAWGQNGFDMPQEIIEALVPGSLVQIEYTSELGDIWLVMPDAAAGWMRVQQQSATTNASKNIAQISYEEIAAACGDDVSTWGTRMQGEASGAWEIYSVKVGLDAGIVPLVDTVDFAGFACTGDAWGQNGFDMTPEFLAALVPGSVIEIQYTSEMNNLWIVMPDAAAGWMRVQQQTAAATDSICQITYEQIAELCGDDVSTWGARLQCESEGAWEVYSVKVGQPSPIVPLTNKVDFAGFACTGDAWGQNGFDMTPEFLAALVPGSVVEVNYTSETGELWLVVPDASAGWMRIQQQTAACNGTVCQITYEQIAEMCGDDVSTWGARLQCESDGAWEVYSVSVGTPK